MPNQPSRPIAARPMDSLESQLLPHERDMPADRFAIAGWMMSVTMQKVVCAANPMAQQVLWLIGIQFK